jgi:ribosomal protein S18 acetylase RimI-like enzyme
MEIVQTFESEVVALLNKDIQDLHASLYPDLFKEFEFDSVNNYFKKIMENPNFLFLIIKDNDQNFGYTWIEIRDNQENAFTKSNKSIFIHHLSIAIEHRNKGLGLTLMNKIKEIAIDKGIGRIELDYWNDNEIAKKFYEKSGFIKYREFVYKDF